MEFKHSFQYLSIDGTDFSAIEKELVLPDTVDAPVKKGDKIGDAVYRIGNEKIGSVDIIATENITRADFKDYMLEILERYFC